MQVNVIPELVIDKLYAKEASFDDYAEYDPNTIGILTSDVQVLFKTDVVRGDPTMYHLKVNENDIYSNILPFVNTTFEVSYNIF